MTNEKIKRHITGNCNHFLKLTWITNSKIKVRLTGTCLKQEKVTFNPRNVVNLLIVYKLDGWLQDINSDFTLKDCLFGAITLNENAYPDIYSFSGCGFGFDSCLFFP